MSSSLNSRLLLLPLSLICSQALVAQSDGPLVAPPAFILVDEGTETSSGVLATDVFHRKTAGFKSYGPEVSPAGVGHPIFTTTALFGGGVVLPDFEINAYSVGLDVVMAGVPAGGFAQVLVPPGSWGAIEFSVTRETIGEPGSLIAEEVLKPDGAAADLFTLMVPGSFLPPSVAACYPEDRPQRGQDALEMDLYAGDSVGEISAVDFYTPLYQVGPPVRALLPDEPTVFFSVAFDAVFPAGGGSSSVPTAWFLGSVPSSATILRTTWDMGSGSWSMPMVHMAFDVLGLALEDDIDALAVEKAACKLLFSIADTSASTIGEQLQIAAWPCSDSDSEEGRVGGYTTGVAAGIYVVGGGDPTSVAERMLMGAGGDVDGVCTIDPGDDQSAMQSAMTIAYGSPSMAITPLKILGSGVYRDVSTIGPTLTMTVTNVPTEAPTLPAFLEMWLGTPMGGGGGYFLFPAPIYSEFIDGSVPVDYRDVSFTIPSLGTLAPLPVDFFWVVRPSSTIIPSSAMLRITI